MGERRTVSVPFPIAHDAMSIAFGFRLRIRNRRLPYALKGLSFLLAGLCFFTAAVRAQDVEHAAPLHADEVVVLLHGLARSSWSMASLEKHLKREGYTVVNVDYPSTSHPVEYLADTVLHDVVSTCCKAGTVHFVTHSMGGILVRKYLRDHPLANLGRVVMLSPPNQGSELVDVFRSHQLFDAVNGPAGRQLGTDSLSMPLQLGPVAFEVGILTGDKSHNPLFSSLIPGPDDGKVSVARARVEGMTDFLVVPFTHTFIMNQPEIKHQVVHFLTYGQFDRSGFVYPTR